MFNWQEYTAGTDPTNALSYLKIDTLSLSNGTAVQFSAISNRTYSIQYKDSVGSTQWFKLGDVLALASNRLERIPDPASTTNRFYRLVTPRQP
jgi:hypothetical protein